MKPFWQEGTVRGKCLTKPAGPVCVTTERFSTHRVDLQVLLVRYMLVSADSEVGSVEAMRASRREHRDHKGGIDTNSTNRKSLGMKKYSSQDDMWQ